MFLQACRSLIQGSVIASGRKFSRLGPIMAAKMGSGIAPQDFHYFLVLDFEATCIKNGKPNPQEIIEFPVLKVSGKTFEVESVFHTYVEPQVHGISEFCTELTGITSSMVKDQPSLDITLKMFHEWMEREDLLETSTKSVFVTCGDWDLRKMQLVSPSPRSRAAYRWTYGLANYYGMKTGSTMEPNTDISPSAQILLPGQCSHFNWPRAKYFNQWINLKKAFARVTGVYPKGLVPMLEHLDMKLEGRLHSGIDDCRNIATILKALAERRYRFAPTGSCR